MRLCHCHRMTGSYDYLAPSLLGHLCTKLKAIRCLSDKQYLSVSGRFCLRVGHESLFQNPIQPNPKFLDPTHKRLHPTQPITQPIIDTWYCILGDTENFIQQLLHVTDKFTVNDSRRTVFANRSSYRSSCVNALLLFSYGHSAISNQQSRETVVGTSASITVSSVTTLNNTF